jgi:hypothetical protein
MDDNIYTKFAETLCQHIDGSDVRDIWWKLQMDFRGDDDDSPLDNLMDDLSVIFNDMYCIFGCDYGCTQDWTICTLDLVYTFHDYVSNELNLNKVVEKIITHIKK